MSAPPPASTSTRDAPANARREAELPRISVIIPVRNDAARLNVCLRSLREQLYPAGRWELIVVDNGSTDASPEVARQWGATVLSFPGLKVGALRNRGVAASRGDILAFVDADHELPPDWLRRGLAALDAEEGVAAVGAPYDVPQRATWVQRIWSVHRLRRRGRHTTRWLGSGNLFVRREAFLRVGGFREDLVAAEDVDLCLRLARTCGPVVCDPTIVNWHHGEPATLWQFVRKEFWRGSSGLWAFLTQGMPLQELLTLIYPLYHFVGVVLALTATSAALLGYVPWMAAAAVWGGLVAPAFVLGLKTAWQTGQPACALPLALLYFLYGLVRAAALFKP
jgi:GT2 family glycosyltransferase